MKKDRFLPREIKIAMTHVDKGWGWERWICNGPEYCGKLLYFLKRGFIFLTYNLFISIRI